MDLGLPSLGQRALALLGLNPSQQDSPAVIVTAGVPEGPAATAPAPEEPAEPAHQPTEENMSDTDKGAADQAALNAAAVAATQAANARWMAVLSHENAKGRMKAAIDLLGKTETSAEAIVSMIADWPTEAGKGGAFAAAMDKEPEPKVGPGAPAPSADTGESLESARAAAKERMKAKTAHMNRK